jgi:hypothetical protein
VLVDVLVDVHVYVHVNGMTGGFAAKTQWC